MRPIDELLRYLTKSDVTELALAAGRLPCVKQNGAFVPVEQVAVDEDSLVSALLETGGASHLALLGDKPISWRTEVPGLGVVAVMALRRSGVVQTRFVLQQRDPNAVPPSSRKEVSFELDTDPRAGAGGRDAEPRAPLPSMVVDEPAPSSTVRAGGTAASLGGSPGVGPSLSALAAALGDRSAAFRDFTKLPDELATVLASARRQNATDVHLVADRLTTFRINGALVPQGGYVASAQVDAMLRAIVPERLASTLERTGSCDFTASTRELGRFRVNVARQRSGLKGCFRLISLDIPQLTLLGLPMTIAESTHHHQGLILVTGPSGSGKSTTLAAIVDILNRETGHHIITIEDPIEHLHVPKKALLSQREVGTHTKSFAAALKASLREDPDVIVVGELRDTETVRMALTASETGHLVLATMNTPSAAKTIERLIDLFPTADQGQVRMSLAGGLRLIVGQRLVPSLQGGMVAASEMLPGNVPLWTLIREGRTFQIPSLQQRGKQLGIIRLDDQLADLVRGGRISMEAARFVAESPDFGK